MITTFTLLYKYTISLYRILTLRICPYFYFIFLDYFIFVNMKLG
nr:MAG TPA: hypothetical protein [Crassvirales sp.]